jgi:hypothetical protein
MAPWDERSLSTVPLHRRGRVVGVMCLADPSDITGARQCLRMLASMAALRATEGAEISGEAVQGVTPTKAEAEPVRNSPPI